MSIRDAMRAPICSNCSGPAMLGEISLEKQQLRVENVRLQDELNRVCTLAEKFLGRPVSSLATSISSHMPNSGQFGTHSWMQWPHWFSTVTTSLPLGNDNGGVPSPLSAAMPPTTSASGAERSFERSIYVLGACIWLPWTSW
ncbi:hypothetical protein GIB67_041900 [Kingdonia uniflora]|uniref:Uncharacterized protein n=1 Tax=Kingdonia uniflora TaxID=39325 RepID=A0A7J7MI91_9MAGN|nr:hypothetical protein GIB67_001870 [Kingdonia uniflora]KAF6154623.1 hypothetical protein GIB67_041900 [Kingdonia uniflora]